VITSWLRCLPLIAGLLLVTSPVANAFAQPAESKPVAVVSVAPIQKLLSDFQYLADASGNSNFGRTAAFMISPFTQGIDKTRPIGVVVMTDAQEFSTFGFIPVSDMESLLLIVKEQFGDPQDVGNGVKLLPVPYPVFVKHVGDWAFVATDKDQLAETPEDPAKLLDGLASEYGIAVKGYMQNVPELYRDVFLNQIRTGIELSLEQELDESDEEFAARKAQIDTQLEQIKRVFSDLQDLTIGWNVDATSQGTYLDIRYTAVDGSKLSGQLAKNKEVTTDFAGFVKEDAAVSIQTTQLVDGDDVDQAVKQLQQAREQALKQLATEGDLEGEELESATMVVDLMIDTLIETLREGKLDIGLSLSVGDDQAVALIALRVADGKRIEDGFKELVALAQKDEDFPEVTWDADTYETVRFHQMSLPMDDAPKEAKQVLGENPMFVLGIGERAAFISIGKDAVEELKAAIDQSKAKANDPSSLLSMKVDPLPIMKKVQQNMDKPSPGLDAAIEALTGGSNLVTFTSEIDGNAFQLRLLVQEGIIKAIGAATAAENAAKQEAVEADF